jgi:RES domain
MLLYRIAPYLGTAPPGRPGHPLYKNPHQGHGRFDNPSDYSVWYLSYSPSGAVAEVFADLLEWTDPMFEYPKIAGARRALMTFTVPDNISLLDLDDAQHLLERGLRPTQVVERNRPATQSRALRVFEERNRRGDRRWDGIRWWSIHRPQWELLAYWGSRISSATPIAVEKLDTTHNAVVDAATALSKPIV